MTRFRSEDLWRDLPSDRAHTTARVEAYRQLYNHIRRHKTLVGARPIERYSRVDSLTRGLHHNTNIRQRHTALNEAKRGHLWPSW